MDVINDPYRQGSTLNTILGSLLQYKADSMRHNQLQKAFADLGLSEKQSSALPHVPESIQKEYVKQHMQQPANEAYARALGLVSGEENQQQAMQPMQQGFGQVNQPLQPTQQPTLNPHQAEKLAELKLKKQEIGRSQNKEIREYLQPYENVVKRSKDNIRDYKLLVKLADKKDLRNRNVHVLLKRVGLEELGKNPTTELVDKLSARLAQNSATAFGSTARITNYLEQTFQRSIPSLMNTPQGIKAISEINMRADEGNILQQNARRNIIKQNGFIPPDIDAQVEQATGEQINKLAEEAYKIALNASGEGTPKVEQRFEDLPKASDYPNRRIRGKNGQIFKSVNGKWVKE